MKGPNRRVKNFAYLNNESTKAIQPFVYHDFRPIFLKNKNACRAQQYK